MPTKKEFMPPQYRAHPFLLAVEDVAEFLSTDTEKGLQAHQITKLREEYGSNELDVGSGVSKGKILLRQMVNCMVIVLVFAMAVSFGVQDWVEGGVLAFVILLNSSIGFWQELKAENDMEALRSLSSPSARVIRNGQTETIPNSEVVPGDIIDLRDGDTVPADLRIVEAMNLACNEMQLTGETTLADKTTNFSLEDRLAEEYEKGNIHAVEHEVGKGDRLNIAHAGTEVKRGRGRGIAVLTGMNTEVGKITKGVTSKDRKPGRSMNYKKYGKRSAARGASLTVWDKILKYVFSAEGTPLQRKLATLAGALFLIAVILAVGVFGANNFHVPVEVLLYSISVGIAIIPESLVAVLTITMVGSVKAMKRDRVVVRDLSAVEALGGVTNICSDKTGTLTQGKMIVKNAWLALSKTLKVEDAEDPYNPTEGEVIYSERRKPVDGERNITFAEREEEEKSAEKVELTPEAEDLNSYVICGALCNSAHVFHDATNDRWAATGEPTDVAIAVLSERFGVGKKSLEKQGWKQVGEFPFDSDIKRMSVVYDPPENDTGFRPENSIVFTKGAVERITDLCSTIGVGDKQQPLTEELKEQVTAQMDAFAARGQRVLALAMGEWKGRYVADERPAANPKEMNARRARVEKKLTLLGLAGIYDPPRLDTAPSIKSCSQAGITVHMLTGDHEATARAIAIEVGILPRNFQADLSAEMAHCAVMRAADFDQHTDDQLDELPALPLVIARCSPNTKTRMVDALNRRGAFVAMTGDGVNDAPSLKKADVGIAMGSGSDVAKSASKIMLSDDKFNSIVKAVSEGRRMFDNIQRFVLHLLSSNVAEVIVLMGGLGFKDAQNYSVFPLSPLAIIWINLATSSLPAFGLGREKAALGVMRRPPSSPRAGIFTAQIIVDMLVYGIVMGVLCIGSFLMVLRVFGHGDMGVECNRHYSESCYWVYRGRSTVAIELTFMILLSAWEFKDLRRSMFALREGDARNFVVATAQNLFQNWVLFWSVILGVAMAFIPTYTGVVARNVFKQEHIGGMEWALIGVSCLVYLVAVELWKTVKRGLGLLENPPAVVDLARFDQGRAGVPALSEGRTITLDRIKNKLGGMLGRTSTSTSQNV